MRLRGNTGNRHMRLQPQRAWCPAPDRWQARQQENDDDATDAQEGGEGWTRWRWRRREERHR